MEYEKFYLGDRTKIEKKRKREIKKIIYCSLPHLVNGPIFYINISSV